MVNFASSNENVPIETIIIEPSSDGTVQDYTTAEGAVPVIISNLTDGEIRIKLPDFVSAVQLISFRVRATAKGGATLVSGVVNLKLKNCNNIFPRLVDNTTFMIETFPNSLDISQSFESLDPIECPLTGFKIDKIVRNSTNSTEKVPEKIATIDKAGLVSISIQDPIDIYYIYI